MCTTTFAKNQKKKLPKLRLEGVEVRTLSGLSALVLANALYQRHERSDVAMHMLHEIGLSSISLQDVAFAFEKTEAHVPGVFLHAPRRTPRPYVSPCALECSICSQAFDAHRKEIPLDMYTGEHGIVSGIALELHCQSCDSFYMGPWRYKRQHGTRKNAIEGLVLLEKPSSKGSFVIFAGERGLAAIGMTTATLRRASSILHNARGSFEAIAECLCCESECPRMEEMQRLKNLSDRIVKRLWVPFALVQFLAWEDSCTIDWAGWITSCSESADAWLVELHPTVRKRFVVKWLLGHVMSCTICARYFGLGLDGKRGMKRFVCAFLDGPRIDVEFLGTSFSQPCPNKPKQGSAFCKLHDTGDDEAVDPACEIADHRRAVGASLNTASRQ